MFAFKFVFVFVIILFVQQAYSNNYDKHLNLIDAIKLEPTCAMQGGMCVIAEDCPQPTAIKGLCPEQRHLGVECCYGISSKETRCSRRGGQCTTQECNAMLKDKYATDCNENESCCIYV